MKVSPHDATLAAAESPSSTEWHESRLDAAVILAGTACGAIGLVVLAGLYLHLPLLLLLAVLVTLAYSVYLTRAARRQSRQLAALNFLLAQQIEQRQRAQAALAHKNRALTLVCECDQALVHATDEDELLQRICDLTVMIGGYRLAWVGYAEPDDAKTVRIVAKAGPENDYLQPGFVTWADVDRGRGPTGTAIRSGAACLCHDVLTEPSFTPWRERAQQHGFRSCLALPLLSNGAAFGALSIYAPEPNAFDDAEIALLTQLANDLAYGIGALHTRAGHKQAEQQLRKASLYARGLLEASLDPLVTISKDGRIMDVNQATESVTGVSRHQLIGSDFSSYFTDPATARAGYRRVFAEGFVRDFPLAIRHLSGRLTDVLYNAVVFKDETGQVEGVFAAARDVTERKHMEMELATRLSQQVALAEISQVAVRGGDLQQLFDRTVSLVAHTLDVECCKVLELLPGGGELLLRAGVGWQPGLVGRARVAAGSDSQAGYTLLSDAAVVVDDLRTETRFSGPPLLHEHGVVSGMSVVIRLADGVYGVLGAHTRRRRQFLPDDVRLLASAANVLAQAVERDRAEQRLQQQQSYTRSLIEASLDPLMTTDGLGTITDVNRQMEELTACPRTELIGSVFRQYCTEPERAEEGIQRVLREGQVTDYELTVRSRHGRETVVAYNATTYRDSQGRLGGIFAAARDITERKRAEHALEQYAAELKRSNAELQDFAYIASHDLQEPLRKITAFGDRLREHCSALLDDTSRDYLGRMLNASTRMAALIDGLLQYSRVSTRAEAPATVDLMQIAFEVVVDLEARIHACGARVQIGVLPRLQADRTQMRQLLQNLIANALKFRRPGEPPLVRLCSQPAAGGWCEISVQDNGIGFEESYLNRLFRPFQRLHGRGEYEGSGMGLAICRKIAERHGGSITARSRPGEGSTFLVRLPAMDLPIRRLADLPILQSANQ